MGFLEWHERPELGAEAAVQGGGPTLVAAFEGWNDAGDAATTAVEHLWETWQAVTLASIDPEEFYDFTASRPTARTGGGSGRTIDWPANELGWATPPGTNGVVLLRGVEPQLRWRTFCDEVLGAASDVCCEQILTVGALLADVPHTRPTPVFGTSDDVGLRERMAFERSEYQGPTGIVGVLGVESTSRGIPAAALWAAVPSYAPSAPSPKAAGALVRRITSLLGTVVDTSSLDAATISYEHQLGQLVAEDDATLGYVQLLERQHDAADRGTAGAVPDSDEWLDEVERFLRDQ
ncbi:MAG: PAC2 family protein [Actinobacteria bacterium]|nr:PAC2 family protein [Actinomycetota bacterium]